MRVLIGEEIEETVGLPDSARWIQVQRYWVQVTLVRHFDWMWKILVRGLVGRLKKLWP
jgi:hypothetical protein